MTITVSSASTRSASTVLSVALAPVAGNRFQPTGFPDLGAATFEAFIGQGWTQCLHVESPQSMANRLEATTWAGKEQVSDLDGVPYVRVVGPDGAFLTSSRLEAHRLSSAYVRESVTRDGQPTQDWLRERLRLSSSSRQPMDQLAADIFELDPLSLIHGVFFAIKEWPEQPKIARAVTVFIDAEDVRQAISGGVKTDSVSSKGGASESAGAEAGYGMVPHHRQEFTARSITAHLVIDHRQIASYRLGPERTAVLDALIGYELAHVFRDDLRLRTACHLRVDGDVPPEIPTVEDATQQLRSAIEGCPSLGEVTTVTWAERSKKKK